MAMIRNYKPPRMPAVKEPKPPESIIVFAIKQAIAENPGQMAAEVLRLIRAEAELQAENAMLKARLAQMIIGLRFEYG